MFEQEWLRAMGLGGLFILLGVGAMFWGRSEEKAWYNSIATRLDVREYLEHLPFRPEPHALRIGGRIAIACGLLLLAIGVVLLVLD